MKELEIELKAVCTDHHSLINRLISLGGKFVKREDEKDIYFTHPSRDFIKTDEAFRIRRSGENITLTYKGPRLGGKAKSRVEEEVKVSDHEKMKDILAHLGFSPAGEVVKTRDTYRYDDIYVCIDIVRGLGEYVELEKKGPDMKDIEEELLALAGNLGLDIFEKRSYIQLLEEKKGQVNGG